MNIPIQEINSLDPRKPSNEIGIIPKSGMIVYNADIDHRNQVIPMFFMFRVGGGGDLYIRGINGEVIPFLGLVDGQTMVAEGNMILSSATIEGHAYSSTCTDICVYGGQ